MGNAPDIQAAASPWGRVAHAWHEIEGYFDYEPVYDAAVERARDGAVFVEVGCLVGRSTCYLAARIQESGKAITVYAVDTGRGSPGDVTGDGIAPALGGEYAGVLHRNLIGCGAIGVVVPILTESTRAARLFAPGSVDFCFIDGDHRYEAVRADLAAWWPKIRPGGTIAGHDYRVNDHWGKWVTAAVHDHFGVSAAAHPESPHNCWCATRPVEEWAHRFEAR